MAIRQEQNSTVYQVEPVTESVNEPEQVKKLKKTQSELTQIDDHLKKFVDIVAQNPSLLSKASTYWGNRPLWQKIVVGLVLVSPPLLIGLLANIIAGIVITTATLACYIGISVLLDDHHKQGEQTKNNIDKIVNNLAGGLKAIIGSLEQIGGALTEQVSIFKEENAVLGGNVSTLGLHTDVFTGEVDSLKEVEKKLRLTVADLEADRTQLTGVVACKSKQLIDTQALLDKITSDYTENQKQLEEKNQELNRLNVLFKDDEGQYRQSVETIQKTLLSMSETTKTDKQIEPLYAQLTTLLERYSLIVDRLGIKEKELDKLRENLKIAKKSHEDHVSMLSKLSTAFKSATSVTTHGLFPHNTEETKAERKNSHLPFNFHPNGD